MPKVEPSPRKDVEWEEVDLNHENATLPEVGSNASHTYSEEFTSQPDYEETQDESVLLTDESLAQNFPKIEPSLQISSLGEEEPSRMDSEIQSTGDFSEPELIENIVDSSSEEFRQEATEIPSFSPVSPDSSVEFHLNPIHQFVPQTETSEFCAKLTAMAQVNV